jgi:hypothetical protein
MLPSFFESVLQLIVRTSTDLPPDVRAAMKTARDAEPDGTRSSQGLGNQCWRDSWEARAWSGAARPSCGHSRRRRTGDDRH